MAKFIGAYHFHEVQTDKAGNAIKTYKDNLPHAKRIVNEAVANWNSIVKPSYLGTGFDDDIVSVRAYPSKTDSDAMCVAVDLAKGCRWNADKRYKANESISAQFCDG